MSETLTDRIKYISSMQPDHLMSAFASDLNEIVTRAEAAEARAAQLEAERKGDIENLRHYMELVDSWIDRASQLEAERGELAQQLAEARGAIADAVAEEREACAAIIAYSRGPARDIAAAIRDRK